MSSAVASGTQGTLAQRRQDAVVVSTGRPTATITRSTTRSARLRSRVRYSVSKTFTYRVIVGILAALSVAGMLTVVFSSVADLDSAAYYRSALFSFHGIAAMMAISAVVDQELFDLRSTIVFSVVAFALNVFLAVVELMRHYTCPNGATQLDISICADSPGRSALMAWISLALALLALAMTILAGVWQTRRVAELRAIARLALLNAVANGSEFRESMDAQIESERTRLALARQRRIARELTTGAGIFRAVVAVLLLLSVLLMVVLNVVYFRSAAFYRGALLIVPAHLAGCMFAFFGRTPNWWRWITLVFAILSLASALTAAIVDWPRYYKCLRGEPFTKQIEEDICTQEGFLVGVWPIVSLVVALLSILAAVSVILSARRAATSTTVQGR